MLGIVKLGAVVFLSYTVGGAIGLKIANAAHVENVDRVKGTVWAGRAMTFVALGYVASKI
jgi:hypothetical protein